MNPETDSRTPRDVSSCPESEAKEPHLTESEGVRDSMDAPPAAKDKSTPTDIVLQTFVLTNGLIVERRFKDREIGFHEMADHERVVSTV